MPIVKVLIDVLDTTMGALGLREADGSPRRNCVCGSLTSSGH
jgi:hypothetical protein